MGRPVPPDELVLDHPVDLPRDGVKVPCPDRVQCKVLRAIGRFVNGAIKDMAADTRGRGVSAGDEDITPDWERKDLGI